MRGVEYASASTSVSSPYQDSSSYSRGSIGSISGTRTNDVESQYKPPFYFHTSSPSLIYLEL